MGIIFEMMIISKDGPEHLPKVPYVYEIHINGIPSVDFFCNSLEPRKVLLSAYHRILHEENEAVLQRKREKE